MDFRQLKAFLSVAETGNVTRAAELMNIVQPVVTRQVRLLEGDVGAGLFDRGRHGRMLTEADKPQMGYADTLMHLLLPYLKKCLLLQLQRQRFECLGIFL